MELLNESKINNNLNFSTRAIHILEDPKENYYKDIVAPINLTSTYLLDDLEVKENQYFYTRYDNQTRNILESKLASLENSKFCLTFSSGMSAISTTLLSLVKPNSIIISFDDIYSVTKKIFEQFFIEYNIKVIYFDFSEINSIEEFLNENLNENVSIIYLESPTNPLLKITDIKKIVSISKKLNNSVKIIFDNTFLSPYFYNPLNDGVDVVVHSLTKYINGHSDVIAGAIMTNNQELFYLIKRYRNMLGGALSPFDSYLIIRGLKTLALRMEKHQQNAMILADYLKKHPKVKKVLYPGLKEHKNHEIIKNYAKGFGGVISFELDLDNFKIKKFLSNLKLISNAVSLGGVESLICIPYFSTHKDVKDKEKIGITPNLVRLSVGIEEPQDLIQDLEIALNNC
ncbi:MAG: PLP-dependent aspartate aminotransferase family protein [bacterium]|nr:PLP-dependent aspartate aminotransferase family protein [bacterium]